VYPMDYFGELFKIQKKDIFSSNYFLRVSWTYL